MPSAFRTIAAATALCCLLAAVSAPAGATDAVRESFDLQVPVAPTPVVVDGRERLVYEVHLTNFSGQVLLPLRVDVLGADNGAAIAAYSGAALRQRLAPVAGGQDDEDPALPPGMRGLVYVELDLDRDAHPRALEHRITYAVAGGDPGVRFDVRGAPAPIGRPAATVLGAPLRGGPWAAVYGPEWERGHRRVVYTADGRATIPGRFAVDWFRLDDDGRLSPPEADDVRAAHGYGEEVLAVDDATVAGARDDYPEAGPDGPPEKRRLADAAGNYLVLRLDDGRHVFYEHLAPGSLRVAVGARVQRGQVIAELGSTGDSRRAHLHFHVADGPSTLGAEGLPFALDRFRLLGRYADIAELGKVRWHPLSAGAMALRRNELPPPNHVLTFGPDED